MRTDVEKPIKMMFVGPDPTAFFGAVAAFNDEGNAVECLQNPFKALCSCAATPPDVIVIDASSFENQMLDVFDALREAAPTALVFAALSSATRWRTAKVLNLGADAVISIPADPEEIRALIKKLKTEPLAPSSLDDKFEWLGQFAAGVAHNINNPLTTVIGYLQILCQKVDDNQSSVLPTMLKECKRISDIVKNLLLMSGNGNIEPRQIDVNSAVDSAIISASQLEQNDKVRIERSYAPSLPPVLADENALRLACENIALNARHAMANGGTLSIETARNGHGLVMIRFTDSGPGIEPGDMEKIFEPFYTTSNNGHVGLGLAAAYGIVKGFGGTIKVKSQRGAGTTFQIELPSIESTNYGRK